LPARSATEAARISGAAGKAGAGGGLDGTARSISAAARNHFAGRLSV